MSDPTAERLARTVAAAADAWLTDPLDTQVYSRLVSATLAWRDYTQPMLAGTESLGHAYPAPDPGVSEPQRVLAGQSTVDPRVLLAHLAGGHLPAVAEGQ